jgi:F420-non-reducing hydrogenase iron-sulfur subunit
MGIKDERLRLEWISASEGEKLKNVVNDMVARLKEAGPLGMPKKFKEWDKEIEELEEEINKQEQEVTSDV